MRALFNALIVTLTLLCLLHPAAAATHNVSAGDNLFDLLQIIGQGDEVIVDQGTYTSPGFVSVTWSGTSGYPILIRAAPGARPVLQGVEGKNVLNIEGSHFTLRGFEIVGGSHGLRLGNVDNATLEDLKIHGTSDVGISCNREGRTCERLTVRRCEIYDTNGRGEGMYIGCNEGLCTVRDSVFELNYIHDLGGDQGDGIEIKTGSYGNLVRDNIIVNTKFPGITVYGFTTGAGALNVVERNLVWGTEDNGIQVVGQVIVRNNIVVNAHDNGIHSKPSQDYEPHHVTIVNNTIFSAGNACLKTNDWSDQDNQLIANNALYCDGEKAIDLNGGAPQAVLSNNVILGTSNASSGTLPGVSVSADLGDPSSKQFYPPTGSALLGAGDPTHAPADDFEGTARSGSIDVGAYQRTGNDPKWAIIFDFKPEPSTTTNPGDAGPVADAGTAADGGTSDDAQASSKDGRPNDGPPTSVGDRSSGIDTTPPTGAPDEGCGCRMEGDQPGVAAILVILFLAPLTRQRRRSPTGQADAE